MIDLHCHLLPGVDDGPPDVETSLAMARTAVKDGVSTIVATPHVSSRYQTDPRTIADRVAALQSELDDAGIPLTVKTGAEINLAMFGDLDDEALQACALAGGKYLLVEAPFGGPVPFIDRLLFDLQVRGFRIVLAHPERISAFQKDVDLLERMVDRGALCSITGSSLVGRFGKSVRSFSLELLQRGLVHNISSDAHDPYERAPGLGRAFDAMPELEPWRGWLTVEAPEAILRGEGLSGNPPRLEPPRGLLSRLRRR